MYVNLNYLFCEAREEMPPRDFHRSQRREYKVVVPSPVRRDGEAVPPLYLTPRLERAHLWQARGEKRRGACACVSGRLNRVRKSGVVNTRTRLARRTACCVLR